MTVKTNQSIINRFIGTPGKKRLLECVCKQSLVAGDISLAKQFVKYGQLLDIPINKKVIEQGGRDNDLYFIIGGSVSVSVNGREIASRDANTHFGDMALIDTTSRRSATITTKERSILLKISETGFTKIAKNYPLLWRQIAVCISSRLRERDKFHVAPRNQPVVFIGSSSESLDSANAINKALSKKPIITKLWTEGVFQASKTTIEDLWRMTTDVDFAVIVLSSDDVCVFRGKKKNIPRDNAVFELGLFLGALGRERAIFVTPNDIDIKIPTDLLGITCLRYKGVSATPIGRRLQTVCSKLWQLINVLGPR